MRDREATVSPPTSAESRIVNTGPNSKSKAVDVSHETLTLRGGAAVDWLTLTTWDKDTARWMQRELASAARVLGKTVAEAKRMQYVGMSSDFFFLGEGQQSGKTHYLIQVWGGRAHAFAADWSRREEVVREVRCTRLDVQYTVPEAYEADLPGLGRALRRSPKGDWMFVGRRPQISYYDNDQGKHTLYLGVRTSDRMIRFYNKEVEEGVALRYEIEYKGSLAYEAFVQLSETGERYLAALLHSELYALPQIALSFLSPLRNMERMDSSRLRVDRTEPDLTATLNWIYNAVVPAVQRMMLTGYSYEVAEALHEAMGMRLTEEDKALNPRRSLRN